MTTHQKSTQDLQPWRAHVLQWHSSGLTQVAYCRQHDLCQHSFSYHKRKWETEQLPTAPAKPSSSGFVSLQLQSSQSNLSRFEPEPLTLHFANGVRLSGIAASNVGVVKLLAEALV